MAKIKHTRNENGQNFTHQNKTTVFCRKKAKINLHQNFPIYGIGSNKVLLILGRRTGAHREDCHPVFLKKCCTCWPIPPDWWKGDTGKSIEITVKWTTMQGRLCWIYLWTSQKSYNNAQYQMLEKIIFIPPQQSCREVYWCHHVHLSVLPSVRLSVHL